jgi:hypothetical protein
VDKTEWLIVAIVAAMIVGLAIMGIGFTTGKFETRKIFHASSTTDCVIVSRGAQVSVDCWIVEGEHEHE